MSLLPEKTTDETDLEMVDEAILAVAEASHHLASVLRRVWSAYWAIPTDRLLALMNADVARTLAIFGANTPTGEAVNFALDAVGDPRWTTRAPVVMGREDIVYDTETGQFVLVPAEL